jgi:protein NrfD
MIEEIITSGRMNPGIDPVLHAWGWEIPLYLFLGGISAGLLFFAALLSIQGKAKKYPVSVMWMPLAVPVLIGIGLLALLFDLSHKLYFWQLYTNIRWESPMSWGAWTLLFITPLSIAWILRWLPDMFPKLDLKYQLIYDLIDVLKKYEKSMAYGLIALATTLGMYTGILLSAFNARPFWNTSILGPLFLISGLSAAAALTAYFAKSHEEKKHFIKIDLFLIVTEFFLIVHLFMGLLASTAVHIEAAHMFLGGSYTVPFWVLVVAMGLILPGGLELMELRKKFIPAIVPVVLIVMGNLMLRFIVVSAGQASRWLY